jgi:hypothetical protein
MDPDSAHEAMRDLVRARLAAVRSRHARQQLSGFLLRRSSLYIARRGPRCIAAGCLAFALPKMRIISCWKTAPATVDAAKARPPDGSDRNDWRTGRWRRSLSSAGTPRGMVVAAATIVAELGDISPFS